MPTLTYDYVWPVSKEEVFRILVDYPTRNPDYLVQTHPDVSHTELLDDVTQGNIRHILMEYHSSAEIPAVFQKVIKPEMLKWTAEGWWDSERHFFREEIVPHMLSNYIDIMSKWHLSDHYSGGTLQSWSLEVNCTLPVIGRVFAPYILNKVFHSVNTINTVRIQQLQAERQTTD